MLPTSKDLRLTTRVGHQCQLAETSGKDDKPASNLDIRDVIISSLPVGVAVQDEAGNYLLVNNAAAAHYDVAPRAIVDPGALVSLVPDLFDILPNQASPDLDAATLQGRIAEQPNGTVLLTRQRSIRIGGRSLVLSASLDFTEHKEAENELSRRADFDELTSLPKRALVESYVKDVMRLTEETGRFALVFMDIDNFKHINDYYGHGAGDALLVKLTDRLKREIRQTDMLARIGGDEFLLVLNPVGRTSDVVATVDHLIKRMKAPFLIDGFEVFASASVGVSLYPDHGTTYGDLRQNADTALYQVKNEMKGAFALFNEEMEREATERMELEQSLRLAILEKRFRCAFQPKVDIRTRAVIGIEALVRLYGESGIIQAPGEFIDLATELGLIDELTHLVLEQIMNSLDLIDERFGSGVSISINVAAKQANDLAFMSSFATALAATGCPNRFIIEVTEDAFVRKSQFQSEMLPKLREIGVGVSIDDFGTGYSSLSALAEITADEIKIDRSFITDVQERPRSQAILRAVESLCEALGMTVVAEGVQSHEELAYLETATKIKYAQGYLFAEPELIDQLEERTRTSSIRTNQVGRQAFEGRQLVSRSRSLGR
jgi:diguanylate cyclase (GGDEF)-like protein